MGRELKRRYKQYQAPRHLKRVRYGSLILIEHNDFVGAFALPGGRKGELNVMTLAELKDIGREAGVRVEVVS